MNWEKFQSAYNEADEITKELIDSGVIGDCVAALVTNGSINASQQSKMVLAMSHLLVGATTETEAQTYLTSQEISDPSTVIATVRNCIKTPVTATPDQNLTQEISEAEAQLKSVVPIRTMESDEARVKDEPFMPQAPEEPIVRSSGQEQIFGQRPILGETPSYDTKPAGPQWGSDTNRDETR